MRYQAHTHLDLPQVASRFILLPTLLGRCESADGRGRIQPGAYPVELGVPAEAFAEEIKKREFDLSWEFRWLDQAHAGEAYWQFS